MKEASGIHEVELRVDGGPTKTASSCSFRVIYLTAESGCRRWKNCPGWELPMAGLGAGIYDESPVWKLKKYGVLTRNGAGRTGRKAERMTTAVKMVLASGEGDQSCWRS